MRSGYALIRHFVLIGLIPFVLAVLVPLWLAWQYDVTFFPADGFGDVALRVLGASLIAGGAILYASCVYQIATRRERPLAPWDLPRRLVLSGPYRFVRNPINSGIIFVLFGEALALRSLPHCLWAIAFLLFSFVYVPVLDEPQLEARFGDEYRRYRRHVPRFFPRLRPWKPDVE